MKRQNSSETPSSSKITKEAASHKEDRLEDVFQDEILKAFTDITGFKVFARSSRGLCLDEHVIQDIIENHGDNVVEQKLKMLNLWKDENGKQATAWNIRNLVADYKKGDDAEDYISLDGGRLGLYKNQPLCEQSHVYFGVQKSEITGSYFCAIKLQPNNKNTLREAQILSKLRNHVNVVSILHAGIYRSGPFDYIFIAMDLSWTKTVRNMLEESDRLGIPFNEFIATSLVRQISKAVDFIHSNNIIHRDLKPENVLLSDDWSLIKVTDFEFSKTYVSGFPTNQTNVNIGTDGYRSPETYNIDVKITSKSDIFAFGVMIAEILANGKHPFGKDQYLWSHNISNNKNFDLSNILVSNKGQVINLIKRMLDMDPKKRPTAEEVLNKIKQFKTWLQLKNQQTIADQSSATSSMTQLSTAEKENAIIMCDYKNRRMYSYKLITKEWSKMQYFPRLNLRSTAVVVNKHIYFWQNQNVSQLEYSDPASKWKKMARMKKKDVKNPSAAVLNGLIYFCGGPSLSVERYDATQDRWKDICDRNIARKYPCLVATKDHVYCTGSDNVAVEKYDVDSNQWEFVKSTPRLVKHEKHASAAVANDRIYVADQKGVLCYDIQKNSWSEMNFSNQWPFEEEKVPQIKILAVSEELYILGVIARNIAIYLLEPETEQMTLVEEIADSNILCYLAVKL